jgi:membrane associated rhomboid family serine protease
MGLALSSTSFTPKAMESPAQAPAREPFFNVPPLTLRLFAVLLAIHVARLISPQLDAILIKYLVLTPAELRLMPWTILTYALLHFGWAHMAMNSAGLLAFGSGVERLFTRTQYIIIFIGGVLIGALAHIALFPQSVTPLGGASAGISAQFGALLPMLARGRALAAATGVFIVTNLAVGMMGMPDDPTISIAWQAHLGGFLFGLLACFLFKRTRPE